MYEYKTLREASTLQGGYKLSYIDDIAQTKSIYTPETVEYMKTQKYEEDKKIYGWNNPRVRFMDVPSKNFIPGYEEYEAFFCQVDNIGEVWGDDFNDIPYEHNSGIPYDDTYGPDGERKEISVIRVPFALPPNIGTYKFDIRFPCTNHLNSPWSTEDINLGAIPWIWFRTTNSRTNGVPRGISIMAGITPWEFVDRLTEIWELYTSLLEPKKIHLEGKYINSGTGDEVYVVFFEESGYVAYRYEEDIKDYVPINSRRSDSYYDDPHYVEDDIEHLNLDLKDRIEHTMDDEKDVVDSILNHWKNIKGYNRRVVKEDGL